MISALLYDGDKNEIKKIRSFCRDAVARMGEERLEIRETETIRDLREHLDGQTAPDAAVVDVVAGDGIPAAGLIRSNSDKSEMMVIADTTVSPMAYMTPAIRAASLLLRPYTDQMAEDTFGGFFRALFARREEGEDESFVIENQDGKQLVPFPDICFFEIREKRLYARTRSREYSRYGTLDQLVTELPDYFLRCHRSYVVNTKMIRKIRMTEGLIYLDHDLDVPLSRKYKTAIKEFIHALHER